MKGIKKVARLAIYGCGINKIIRYNLRHFPRIIMYHGFCKAGDPDLLRTPIDQFHKQLVYIKKNFYPLKVSELLLARNLNGVYPENAVAITVDDGYEDFFSLALPILKKLGVPATIYIVADLVEKNNWMWPDKFHYLEEFLKGSYTEFNSKVFSQLLSNFKKIPVISRDNKLKEIAQKYNINIPVEPPPKFKLMSWDQLSDLAKTGLIEFGSHTCNHPIISYLNNKDSWYEINESKCKIAEKLNIEVTSFCYPNGQIGDYREDQKQMLKQAGYLCGIASHFGYVSKKSDIYSLPRISGGRKDFDLFVKQIDGIDYFQKKLSRLEVSH